jgi:putative transposase
MNSVIITRPDNIQENLCLDAGYVGSNEIVKINGYIPHIRPRGEEIDSKSKDPDFKPRRWIVEVAHSWFNRFRKLSPRYEKTLKSCLALHHLAAAIICFRKANIN